MNALSHLWPWIVGGASVTGAVWRLWRGRGEPRRQWEDPESIIFPDGARPARPGRGIARLLSSPMLLALKEAGEAAMAEEMAGLRDDLKRAQADNRRLRAELDGSRGSNDGSSNMDTDSNRPSRTPHPRSLKSDS